MRYIVTAKFIVEATTKEEADKKFMETILQPNALRCIEQISIQKEDPECCGQSCGCHG